MIECISQETYDACGIGLSRDGSGPAITIPPPSTFNPSDVDTDQYAT